MPLARTFHPQPNIHIGLWHTTEDEQQLVKLAHCTSEEVQQVALYKSPRRRKQWLASRALIYAMLQKKFQISYHDHGKPILEEAHQHIALSHSKHFVALAIHESKPIGIDIQHRSPKLKRIAQRFLNTRENEEWKSSDDPELYLHLVWCIKESLYKIYGTPNIIFKEHLNVFFPEDLTPGNPITGTIASEQLSLECTFGFELVDDFVWVFPVN